MNIVVGDLETSENNVNMLSVLEASFVIYDDRFQELESFHESARIRPTAVPSLGACLTTGIRTDKSIEITSGLIKGDIIVAEGLKKVRPRGKIKPINK